MMAVFERDTPTPSLEGEEAGVAVTPAKHKVVISTSVSRAVVRSPIFPSLLDGSDTGSRLPLEAGRTIFQVLGWSGCVFLHRAKPFQWHLYFKSISLPAYYLHRVLVIAWFPFVRCYKCVSVSVSVFSWCGVGGPTKVALYVCACVFVVVVLSTLFTYVFTFYSTILFILTDLSVRLTL